MEESSLQHSNSSASGQENPEWEGLWAGHDLTSSDGRLNLNWGGVRGEDRTQPLFCLLIVASFSSVTAGAEFGGMKPCLVLQYFWSSSENTWLLVLVSVCELMTCVVCSLPGCQSCGGRRQTEILHSGHQQHHTGVSAAGREEWEKRILARAFLVNLGAGLAGVVGVSLHRSSMQNMPRITWKSSRNGFRFECDV